MHAEGRLIPRLQVRIRCQSDPKKKKKQSYRDDMGQYGVRSRHVPNEHAESEAQQKESQEGKPGLHLGFNSGTATKTSHRG